MVYEIVGLLRANCAGMLHNAGMWILHSTKRAPIGYSREHNEGNRAEGEYVWGMAAYIPGPVPNSDAVDSGQFPLFHTEGGIRIPRRAYPNAEDRLLPRTDCAGESVCDRHLHAGSGDKEGELLRSRRGGD